MIFLAFMGGITNFRIYQANSSPSPANLGNEKWLRGGEGGELDRFRR